jgi:hypothetical protein
MFDDFGVNGINWHICSVEKHFFLVLSSFKFGY